MGYQILCLTQNFLSAYSSFISEFLRFLFPTQNIFKFGFLILFYHLHTFFTMFFILLSTFPYILPPIFLLQFFLPFTSLLLFRLTSSLTRLLSPFTPLPSLTIPSPPSPPSHSSPSPYPPPLPPFTLPQARLQHGWQDRMQSSMFSFLTG